MSNLEHENQVISKYKGCVVGGAVGDALGAPAEFLSPADIKLKYSVLKDMAGGGVFKWREGQTTDDTDNTW
jgi:ADP-ribosyl-[dinitrogen reductase] hydrolase